MRDKRFFLLVMVASLAFIVSATALAQESQPAMAGMVALNKADLKWVPAEALPPGAMMAVIREDPVTKAVDFLAKVDANFRVPPHWHSPNERVTVLDGTFITETDGKKHTLTKGGYMYLPGKKVHEAWLKAKSMILVSAEGPFDITYVNPADEPATYKAMKEKAAKGETQ